MASISLNDVTKNYGNTRVLNKTNLKIADGEFLTLVGPSGCGKSTSLRIIAGLESQTSGDVLINNISVNNLRASQRDLAMVFQSYALYPHLSVRQNLEVPLKLRDLSFIERIPMLNQFFTAVKTKNKNIREMTNEVSETLKITHLLDRKPGQLSGGQRQRVALGRAMVRKPAAFLMDEPLSNLDAGLRVHMRAELTELHKSLKTTFIYVTHDQAEALTMSDRMAVMMDGDILQVGKPSEVYESPNTIQVAEFVGSPKINILSCKCNSSGKIEYSNATLLSQKQKFAGRTVFVGIRPEHLILQMKPKKNCLKGSLFYKENLGSDIFLHISINDGKNQLIARVPPHTGQELSLGDKLYFTCVSSKIIVFDEKGYRISDRIVTNKKKS